MIDSDLAQFSELMDGIRSDYGKPPLSAVMLKIDFEVLRPYSFDQITMAIIKHRSNPGKAAFFPTPGDLIEHLDGRTITADMIVAAAKLAETPMGIMARIHIGTWDLNNRNSFDLKQRAEEVLQLLPKWKAKSQSGDYSDHELTIMMKHGVDPVRSGFHHGLALPSNRERLITRVLEIQDSPRYKELTEPSYQPEQSKAAPLSQTLTRLENRND